MKKFWTIVFFVFLLLSILTMALVVINDSILNNQIRFTQSYQNITVEKAKEIINSTYNLSVIDVRGLEGCSACQFRKGHLPGAVMNTNPETLYNSTNDILVYSRDGTKSAWFCEQLMGHVYGKVYNLEGGWNVWNG